MKIMEKEKQLRKEIFNRVKKISKLRKSQEKFIPGQTKINYAGRVYNEKEMINLVDASLDFWLTAGRYAKQFEQEFAKFLGAKYCLLTNSGSSANLLAISALTSPKLGERRLKPGDEVVTTACGFPTTLNPIIQNNLIPVFIDVDLGTYSIQAEKIEKAISKKTKAIFIAHTLGNPVNLDKILEIVKKYNLWFIEDNCDALGSKYKGKYTGTFGDISTFSFFPAHIITMGEGGAVLTNNPLLKKIIASFRDWGRACFVAGTPIILKNKIKNIEDVIIGDLVLTHDGKFLPVTNIFRKTYGGKIYRFKAPLNPPFETTSDHRFFMLRDEKARWIKAENIKKDDLFLEAIPKYTSKPRIFNWEYETAYKKVKCSLKPDKNLMRLIGYWLAEGSVAKGLKGPSGYKPNQKYYSYRVDFCFNSKETKYINDVKKLILRYFHVKPSVRYKGGGIILNFKTRKGYDFFKKIFHTGASNKTLPRDMEYWDLDLVNSLVKGYWRGDGSRSFQSFLVSSSSLSLIEKIRTILIRNHILPYYETRVIGKHKSSVVNGKIIKAKHNLYNLVCYGINGEKFANIIDEKYISRSKRQRVHFKTINNLEYICYPMNKIFQKTVNSIPVYNLEVKDSHSYHAGRVAVHNCWCEPGKDNSCGKRFGWKLGKLPFGYDHKYIYSHIGYNLKITDLQAAIGVAQLKKLPSFIKARQKNFKTFYNFFKKYDKYFTLPQPEKNSQPCWFGFPLLVKPNAPFTRAEIVNYLEENKIATRMLFGGNLTKQPAYQNTKYRIFDSLKNTDLVMNYLFWIGVYPGINKEMLDYVIKSFEEFLGKYT